MGLMTLSCYGVGTIVGVGIYVLIGKVGGLAGVHLPHAFLLSGLIASFTAFAYAELASRVSQSAGEAAYMQAAWGRRPLSQAVGWMIAATGIVSAAAIVNGFAGYLAIFVEVPDAVAITLLVVVMALVAMKGINESAIAIAFITLVEVGGLLVVMYASRHSPPVHDWAQILSLPEPRAMSGVVAGVFLAFYAYIGFEDMVNVVEEVKEPRRNLPLAIFIVMGVSILLYVMVAVVAVRVTELADLSASRAPLAAIVERGGYSPQLIGVMSIFAIVNGALVQLIMASRVLYGMARRGLAPSMLGRVHARMRTPVPATAMVAGLILAFALWLPLTTLAKATSFIVLVIFSLVNLSLIVIKRRGDKAPDGIFQCPLWVPIVGLSLCLALLASQLLGL